MLIATVTALADRSVRRCPPPSSSVGVTVDKELTSSIAFASVRREMLIGLEHELARLIDSADGSHGRSSVRISHRHTRDGSDARAW